MTYNRTKKFCIKYNDSKKEPSVRGRARPARKGLTNIGKKRTQLPAPV